MSISQKNRVDFTKVPKPKNELEREVTSDDSIGTRRVSEDRGGRRKLVQTLRLETKAENR